MFVELSCVPVTAEEQIAGIVDYLQAAQARQVVAEARAKGLDEWEVEWRLELARALFGWA